MSGNRCTDQQRFHSFHPSPFDCAIATNCYCMSNVVRFPDDVRGSVAGGHQGEAHLVQRCRCAQPTITQAEQFSCYSHIVQGTDLHTTGCADCMTCSCSAMPRCSHKCRFCDLAWTLWRKVQLLSLHICGICKWDSDKAHYIRRL